MKFWKTVGTTVVSLISLGVIILFEINKWPAGSSIAGVVLGLSLPALGHCIQDISDTTNWKTSQRKLERGDFINDDKIIRISFSYLFRIKVGDKYLLVRNSRNTGKYQPVGGVYQLRGNEKAVLKNLYHVMDDDKIPIDESSRDDYRLRLKNKYLRKFMKRFDDKKAERERIENVSREFREELIDTGILRWKKISYRYCGRHITDLRFEEHFQNYELLLADIIELIPTPDQERDLKNLTNAFSEKYRFAKEAQITCLGMDIDSGMLNEWIADHTKKILQEQESQLIKMPGTGNTYTVELT